MGGKRDSKYYGLKEIFPVSWVGRGIPNIVDVKVDSQSDGERRDSQYDVLMCILHLIVIGMGRPF